MRLYSVYRWFRNHRLPVRIVICKARRAGLSTGVEALIYDDTTVNPNTYSLILANERNIAENVIQMVRRFWQHTPEQWDLGAGRIIKVRPQIPAVYRNNPPKDRMEFELPRNDGSNVIDESYVFIATARSIDAYLGYGFQNIHATEASRYKDADELFRALYPTLAHTAHSALYVESTPNGQTGEGYWFYRTVMDANERRNTEYGDMRLVFIPWHEMTHSFQVPFKDESKRSQFERTLDQAEKDLVKRFKVSMEQLQWRRMILRGPTFNNDEKYFLQEYPEDLATAFIASGVSVFRLKDIRNLLNNTRQPIWEGDVYWGESDDDEKHMAIHELVRRPKFLTEGQARAQDRKNHVYERNLYDNLRVFRWPEKGERLFICCDVGGGNPDTKDGDYSTIGVGVMKEWDQDEVIMTWRGHLTPMKFAEVAAALSWGCRYMVGEEVTAPELCPEYTGPGIHMCNYLDNKNLYPNLFRWPSFGVAGMPKTKHIGMESNAKSVPVMMGYTVGMIERNLLDIPDEEVVLQMSNYRQHDASGFETSYGGSAGRHDDHVAWLRILCFLLRVRRSIGSGDAEVIEDALDTMQSADTPPWDPWGSRSGLPPMPGTEWRDLDDEETLDSLLWYAGE